MKTTIEAAALLSERGLKDRRGGPVKPDTVKHWCQQGRMPGAYQEQRGPGRGFWLIPDEALDSFTPQRPGRPRRAVGE